MVGKAKLKSEAPPTNKEMEELQAKLAAKDLALDKNNFYFQVQSEKLAAKENEIGQLKKMLNVESIKVAELSAHLKEVSMNVSAAT